MLKAIAVAIALLAMASEPGFAQQSCMPTTTGTNHPASPVHYLSAATDNATLVKGSAVALCEITVVNTTGTLYYIKFYNTATLPVCNTTTVVHTYPVPASTSGNGLTVPVGTGLLFNLGLGFCLTAGIADNDDSSAATGVAINFSLK